MKQFKSNTKLGQVITKEEIASWKGDIIFNSGTGTGKTTFILTNLSEYCKENNKTILFVCNRKVLAEDVKKEIKKRNITNVYVATYQAIESKLKNKKEFALNYDYLALDEFHHHLEVYNIYTDLSFKYLTNHSAQKIYMSATCDVLFDKFIESGRVPDDQYYYIEKDYNYITKLSFYSKKDDHDLIIKDKLQNTDEKVMFFTQSMNRAKETYIDYRDSATFFCSSYTNDTMAKKFLKECKDDFKANTFNNRLLISTSAMDVGISFHDKSIKTIILDIYSWQTLVQCLGRKRLIDELDTCEIYIRDYHRGNLNIYHNNHYPSLYTFINNPDEFHSTYGMDRDFHNPYIFKDIETGQWDANVVAYLSFQQAEKDLYIMKDRIWEDESLQQHVGYGYKNFILDKLKINHSDERIKNYNNEKGDNNMIKLTEYLESIVGKQLFKDEQEELKLEFKNDGLVARTMGINTLNGNLKDRDLPYTIVPKKTNKTIDGKIKSIRYWMVIGEIDLN